MNEYLKNAQDLQKLQHKLYEYVLDLDRAARPGDNICARWLIGDKIWVYEKIKGGVWKLSYFLPCKVGNSVEEIQQYSDICDEMIRKIQRQRKLERIINE